jgi:hypothetical protein
MQARAVRLVALRGQCSRSWAPHTHSYDQLLLLPPLVISTAVVAGRSRRRAIGFAALWGSLMLPGSMLLQGLAGYRNREDFTVLLTLAVFIAIAIATRKDTTNWGRVITR